MARVALETVPRNYKFDEVSQLPHTMKLAGIEFRLTKWKTEIDPDAIDMSYGRPVYLYNGMQVAIEYVSVTQCFRCVTLKIDYATRTNLAILDVVLQLETRAYKLKTAMSMEDLNNVDKLDDFMLQCLSTTQPYAPYVVEAETWPE